MNKELSSKPNDDNARMLTVKEIAERLRISERSVRRQVSRKLIPQPIYIGRLARWRLGTFLEWMDKGCPPID